MVFSIINPSIEYIENKHIEIADIDYSTLNINVEKIREAITPETKAIFTVNLLGNPCNMDVLLEICEDHDLYLIEDLYMVEIKDYLLF